MSRLAAPPRPEAVSPDPLAAGAPVAPAATAGRAAPAAWLVWTALWIVYLVWGSTYLAIALMVETIPPLAGAGARFVVAGLVVWALMAARAGRAAATPTARQLAAGAVVGTLLMGANGVLSIAQESVPTGLAALLIASVPLWVVVLRAAARDRVSRGTAAPVALGFLGVALLLVPGEGHGAATAGGIALVLGSALSWALGSFASPRLGLPRDPWLSTAVQMTVGGAVLLLAAAPTGDWSALDPSGISLRSALGWLYLVTFGSWLAFTAYAWLLQNAPLGTVATYAYVNPVVAIALGWAVLGEAVTALTLAGAAVVVASVAAVVRLERR